MLRDIALPDSALARVNKAIQQIRRKLCAAAACGGLGRQSSHERIGIPPPL